MFLKKKTKREQLRYFRNVLVTSLLVVLQFVTPTQAANALDMQATATLTKDLALAAISEKQANQYAADLQPPSSLDFSDQQAIQLTQDINVHYFFVQNTLKNTDKQTVTNISVPKGYEYNSELTKKMNSSAQSLDLTYDSTNRVLSFKWSQKETKKTAVFALAGNPAEDSVFYAKSVVQGTTFRSNQINLISGANIPANTSSESDSSSTTTTETTNRTTTETSTTTDSTQSTSTTTSATTSQSTTKASTQKKQQAVNVGSSLDDYNWTNCATNEFLSVRSPINPNYYTIIGFGGLNNIGQAYTSLKVTQEQMFVMKASDVANPSSGPTTKEIQNSAVGYLYGGATSWNGLDQQGMIILYNNTFLDNLVGAGKLKSKVTQLQKATSEEGLPMLRAVCESNTLLPITIKVTLKVLSNGRVAHYVSITNNGTAAINPTVYRAFHTWLAGEHMTQAYALGDNTGLYLDNTLKADGSLGYVPSPARAKDPFRINFPIDGYDGQPDNWLGSKERTSGSATIRKYFTGDHSNDYKNDTGDETKNYPAGYNLLSKDGHTHSSTDGGIFFKWNNNPLNPGETKDLRYDTSLVPLGTLTINAEKTYTNETSTDGKNRVGDQLTFDLKAKNASKQIWTDGSIEDVIPNGLTVDPSSFVLVGTDGKATPLSEDVYNASTRTLKVDLSDVNPDEEVQVKFRATIDKDTTGTTITNTMQALDASGNSTPASVDIKVEAGSLTLDSVSDLDFGLNSITTKDTTYDAYAMRSAKDGQSVPNYVQVSDLRGASTGWTLSVAQTDPFTAGSGATLGSNTEIKLTDQKVSGDTAGSGQPSFLADTITLLPNNEAQTVMAAAAKEGAGIWKSAWGTVATEKRYTQDTTDPTAAPTLQDAQVNKGVQLIVPGQVKKMNEQYVTNLDWVLSDTPAP